MGCKLVPLDGSVFALNGVEMGGCWVLEINNFTHRQNEDNQRAKIVQTFVGIRRNCVFVFLTPVLFMPTSPSISRVEDVLSV